MSISIMGLLKDAVSQQVMNKIGGMVGLDQSKSSSAFETAAGSILGGLMNKASTPSGAEAVFGAVEKQDIGILDDLGGLLGGDAATDDFQKQGSGVLEMVFGGNNSQSQQAVGDALGLGSGTVGKLLAMAAPILMGVIGKYVKNQGLDAAGLGSLLGEQKSHLGGLLPASLTSNLGLGDLLGGAGNAASSLAGAASGATSNVAGGGAQAGSGLIKMLLPLLILAALLVGVWYYLNGAGNMVKDGVGAVGDGIGAVASGAREGVDAVGGALNSAGGAIEDAVGGMSRSGLDISGIDTSVLGDQKDTLMGPIGDITQGFGGLATGGEEAATGLADKIGGFGTALEGMGIGDMGPAQKTAVGGILGQFTGVLNGLMAKVPGPLQGIVKPAVDKLLETIQGFGL